MKNDLILFKKTGKNKLNNVDKKELKRFNQQKPIAQPNYLTLETENFELAVVKNQLETKIFELDNANKEIVILSNALNRMQKTRLWQLSEKIRRFIKILLPENSLQRRILKKIYCLYLYFFKYIPMLFKVKLKNFIKYFSSSTNKKSKKIVYIGHSYHDKTQSTAFLINYLKEHFEVTVILDETWQGKASPNLDFIDETYLGVVFFQRIYSPEVINKIKNKNIIFFPMYDGGGNLPAEYWKQYDNVKFINFSRTLHHKLLEFGLDSIYTQYFPKPKDFTKGDRDRVFFWQRITHININIIEKIFKNYENGLKIHLHKAIDPEHKFITPSKNQELKFSISYSKWFKNKEDLLKIVKRSAIYVAPRENEGIGLSFLEAMSMGKAVVAVNNPTMNEYIKHNKTGYLFDLNNIKQIDFSNLDMVQKNCYEFMSNGYQKWEKNKYKIISFIKK